MFGAVTRYLFEYMLGIKQKNGSYGYESIVIEPVCTEYLPEAKGSVNTVRGRVSVEYNNKEIKITVPENITAVFKYKGSETELKAGVNTFAI